MTSLRLQAEIELTVARQDGIAHGGAIDPDHSARVRLQWPSITLIICFVIRILLIINSLTFHNFWLLLLLFWSLNLDNTVNDYFLLDVFWLSDVLDHLLLTLSGWWPGRWRFWRRLSYWFPHFYVLFLDLHDFDDAVYIFCFLLYLNLLFSLWELNREAMQTMTFPLSKNNSLVVRLHPSG